MNQAHPTFFELIEQTNLQHEIFEVQHKSGKAVIMPAEDYDSLQEMLHLFSQSNFMQKFNQSIQEADTGEVASFNEVLGETL